MTRPKYVFAAGFVDMCTPVPHFLGFPSQFTFDQRNKHVDCSMPMARGGLPASLSGDTFRVVDGDIIEDWPGSFAWEACMGGAPAANATLQLNAEPGYMMK
jgi:hypothetical protein